jgi:hypothetical protein
VSAFCELVVDAADVAASAVDASARFALAGVTAGSLDDLACGVAA